MNIYELPTEVEETMKLHDQCFDENGEMIVPQEVYDGIVQELEKLQNKQDDIVHWALVKRANAEADITALENEAKRLLDRCAREAKTVIHMEKLIAHFLPDLDKKVTIGNWDVSYTKSSGTIVLDPLKLPDELLVKTLVPKFDLMKYKELFDENPEAEYDIVTKAPLKEVKEWLELLSEEEREAVKDNVYIEQRKKLKIK